MPDLDNKKVTESFHIKINNPYNNKTTCFYCETCKNLNKETMQCKKYCEFATTFAYRVLSTTKNRAQVIVSEITTNIMSLGVEILDNKNDAGQTTETVLNVLKKEFSVNVK